MFCNLLLSFIIFNQIIIIIFYNIFRFRDIENNYLLLLSFNAFIQLETHQIETDLPCNESNFRTSLYEDRKAPTAFEDWVESHEMSYNGHKVVGRPEREESEDQPEDMNIHPRLPGVDDNLELRVDIEDDERTLDDGTTVRRQIVTRRHIVPSTNTSANESPSIDAGEKVVFVEIEEDILELPPGIADPGDADNLASRTSVSESQECLPDGVPVHRKVTRTIVVPADSVSPDLDKEAEKMVNMAVNAALNEMKTSSTVHSTAGNLLSTTFIGICSDNITDSVKFYILAIFNAKNAEKLKFCEKLEDVDRKGDVFRVAKQMVRKNRDVVGAGCVRDNVGKIVVEEDKLLEVWKEHYDRISNEEFSWDREGLTDVRPVSGPGEKISEEEVEAAIGKMKLGKAAGPSGVVADMLKAAGDDGMRWMTELCNAVVRDGKIPKDWSRSWLVNVYKGKGDALECGSYRGIKLVEHAMKVLERVIERRVRNIVKIDSMQFGFMAGKSTTDAIFIVRQLQEKYFGKE